MKIIDPKPVLDDQHIYLGDNGRAFCLKHAGCEALYTGRDISGQPLEALPKGAVIDGWRVKCEDCR